MIQREEQGEEREREKSHAREKQRAGNDGPDRALHSRARANLVEVADGLHRGCGQHFARCGSEYDGGDHARGCPGIDGGSREGNGHGTRSSSNVFISSMDGAGLSVNAGPCATNPTPTVMSTMPA